MVTFTVKVLICIDMFLKCCAKLKLNTWVRPSGFKDPGKGQRDKDRPADRSVTLLFLCNLANAEMRSPCTFFPHEAHAFRGGFYLPIHLGEPSKKWKKIHSWLMLTDEETFIYTRTFAIIFSCLVNFRPVGAGRIFAFMAEVKIWWAIKIKGWVRELKLHNGVLKAAFQGFASHLSGGSQEMFPLIQFQRKLFKVESVFTTV